MKLGIFSHCTFDTIVIGNSSYEQIGGAACYGAYTAKNLKFDVILHTKFGDDFPSNEYLSSKKIIFEKALSEKPTTKFTIKISGSDRELYLTDKCDPLEYSDVPADGIIISPVFDEVSFSMFEKIKKDSKFIFLDPQGFLRRINSEKKIYLENTKVDLSNVNAIKVNSNELFNLSESNGIEGMKNLQKRGVESVILTNKREIMLLVKDKIYSIILPNLDLFDTTGLGDIFGSSFCCTMLKEKDFFWALSFAGGAVQAALESREIGLKKVPSKGAIETNAAYFYNQIKFKQV